MIPEQIFENIKTLLPILQEFRTKGRATINNDDKLLLKDTYQQIIQVNQMDLACSSCIIGYLSMLEAYHQREHPKFLESKLKMESQIQLATDVTPEQKEEIKPEPFKRGRKKK